MEAKMRDRIFPYLWDIILVISALTCLVLAHPAQAADSAKLIEQLKSPEASVRIQAAQGIAESQIKDAGDALIAALKDENPLVRAEVVTALGTIGDPRTVESILPLLKDEFTLVRGKVVEMLGYSRDLRAADALLAIMKDPNAEYRQRAIRGLGLIADPRAIEPLLAVAKDAQSELRVSAIFALIRFTDAKVVESLAAMLNEKDEAIRSAAVQVLLRNGDVRAFEPALTLLKSEKRDIRLSIVVSVNEMKDPRVPDVLLAATRDIDAAVRSQAVYALAKFPEARVADRLIELMDDQDVQSSARNAIRRLGAIGVERSLAALQQKENPALRIAAAKVMERLRQNPQVVTALIVSLHDDDPKLRLAALQSLRSVYDNRMEEALDALLRDPEREVRVQAMKRYVEMSFTYVPRSADPLLASLRDPDIAMRKVAVQLLGNFHESRITEVLMQSLQDQSPDIRSAAIHALSNGMDLRGQTQIIALLKDPEVQVRNEAVDALRCMGDSRAVEPLIALLKTEKEDGIRALIVSTLNDLKDIRVVEPFVTLLKGPLNMARGWATEMLCQIGDRRAVRPLLEIIKKGGYPTSPTFMNFGILPTLLDDAARQELRTLLTDNNLETRAVAGHILLQCGDETALSQLVALTRGNDARAGAMAITALCGMKGTPMASKAVEALLPLIDTPARDNLFNITLALGEFSDPRAVAPLIKILESQGIDDSIFDVVAGTLGKIKDHRAVEPLLRALNNPSEQVCRAAISALGEIGDPRAISAIRPFANQDKPQLIRRTSILVLCRLGDPATRQAVQADLNSKDAQVQMSAIAILQANPDTSFVSILIERLNTSTGIDKVRAIFWLQDSRDPRTVQPVTACLQDPRADVRAAALQVLLGLREHQVPYANPEPLVKTLCAMLKGYPVAERLQVIALLGAIGDRRAVEPLLASTKDEHSLIRERTVEALGKIGDRQAAAVLRPLLADDSSRVRAAAAIALGKLKDRQSITLLIPLLTGNADHASTAAAGALKAITGQNFGEDADKWRIWWKRQR
ncbi:MAG: HEAT repeat domain-containing protein [Armatimonadota bacterium]